MREICTSGLSCFFLVPPLVVVVLVVITAIVPPSDIEQRPVGRRWALRRRPQCQWRPRHQKARFLTPSHRCRHSMTR
jgi:hypothetical protein